MTKSTRERISKCSVYEHYISNSKVIQLRFNCLGFWSPATPIQFSGQVFWSPASSSSFRPNISVLDVLLRSSHKFRILLPEFSALYRASDKSQIVRSIVSRQLNHHVLRKGKPSSSASPGSYQGGRLRVLHKGKVHADWSCCLPLDFMPCSDLFWSFLFFAILILPTTHRCCDVLLDWVWHFATLVLMITWSWRKEQN